MPHANRANRQVLNINTFFFLKNVTRTASNKKKIKKVFNPLNATVALRLRLINTYIRKSTRNEKKKKSKTVIFYKTASFNSGKVLKNKMLEKCIQ